jgi:hypothetical protein
MVINLETHQEKSNCLVLQCQFSFNKMSSQSFRKKAALNICITWSCENFSQVVSFDEEFVFVSALRVVGVDDGPVDGGQTLDDDGRKALFQELQSAASSPEI